MTRFAFLLMLVMGSTALSVDSNAEEPSLAETAAALQRLGAEVKRQKRTDALPLQEQRDAICISDSWTGGDEGIKYVEQFFRDASERAVDLYFFGTPEISAERIEALRTRNPTLRIREYPRPMFGVVTMSSDKGAYVDEVRVDGVMPGSPADTAGIKVKDVIISLDGLKVWDRRTLLKRMRNFKIGQTITIGVVRAKHERTLKATLASYELLFIEPAKKTMNGKSP